MSPHVLCLFSSKAYVEHFGYHSDRSGYVYSQVRLTFDALGIIAAGEDIIWIGNPQ